MDVWTVSVQIMHDLTVRNSLVHELSDSSLINRENLHLSAAKIDDILRMATNTDVCDVCVRNVLREDNINGRVAWKNVLYHKIDSFFNFGSLVWHFPTIRRPAKPNILKLLRHWITTVFQKSEFIFLLEEANEKRFSLCACETRGFFLATGLLILWSLRTFRTLP